MREELANKGVINEPLPAARPQGIRQSRRGFIRRPMSAVADFGRHRPKLSGGSLPAYSA